MEKRIDDIFDFLDCKKVKRFIVACSILSALYFLAVRIFG